MGAVAGLYGAIFIAFFAALFGGTNTQISGPTAPMTAVSLVVIGGILTASNNNLEIAIPSILIVFFLAGALQIVMGVLKVGQYIKFIPYPVVSGFMTGIGVIILVTQLLPFLGYYPKDDIAYIDTFKPQAQEVLLERILQEEAAEELMVLENFEETVRRAKDITYEEVLQEASGLAASSASGVLGTLKVLPRAIQQINYINLIMAILTILIIYGVKRFSKTIPATLVALLSVSLGAYFLLEDYRTIGDIPGDFPSLHLDIFTKFSLDQIKPFAFSIISLAVLGSIDSLLTSIVADNKTKTRHAPNKELVGQGIGNMVASLFGGIPGAGATIRTVVNIDAGGKTRLSGMIAGALLLLILLVLGPFASQIPAAVLAGILITVGLGVMDYKGLKHIRRLPKSEVLVMLLVLGSYCICWIDSSRYHWTHSRFGPLHEDHF